MTTQEAIEGIRKYECGSCGHQNEPNCGYDGEPDCAYYNAIKALDKQIPKKPKITEKYEGLILSYNCPVCNCYFGKRGKLDVILFNKPKYCNCGQKLNWSEKEDTE